MAAVTVSPSPLPLGILKPGQTVTRNLVIKGAGPFRIVSAAGPSDAYQFNLPEAAKPVHVVPVTFTAGDTPGKISETIRVQTDLPGHETLEVQVDGQIISDTPPADSPAADSTDSENDPSDASDEDEADEAESDEAESDESAPDEDV